MTLLNTAVCWVAGIAVVAGWLSWSETFTSWSSWMTSGYSLPFFFLMFPLLAWALFVLKGGKFRNAMPMDWIVVVRAIPNWMRPMVVAPIAAVIATLATARGAIFTQPDYDPVTHKYVFYDHSRETPTTRAAYLHAVAAQNRFFLAIALVVTSAAFAIAVSERRKRLDSGLATGFPRLRWTPYTGTLAIVALLALVPAAVAGTVLVQRLNAYTGNAIYLRTGHDIRARLTAGHYLVFAGCDENMNCGPLTPSDVFVRAADGASLGVSPDPSSDHLSVGGQSFTGQLSFSVSSAGTVALRLSRPVAQPVFVVRSEGQEARDLAGWIAMGVISLLVIVIAGGRLIVSLVHQVRAPL